MGWLWWGLVGLMLMGLWGVNWWYRYEVATENLLGDIGGAAGVLTNEGWELVREVPEGAIVIADEQLILTRMEGAAPPVLQRRIVAAEGVRHFRLMARVRALEAVEGRAGWQGPRLMFAGLGADMQRRMRLPHACGMVRGTTGWRDVDVFVSLRDDDVGLLLAVQNLAVSGSFVVSHLDLRAARQRWGFVGRSCLIGLLMVLWLVRSLDAKLARWRAFAVAALVLGVAYVMIYPRVQVLEVPMWGGVFPGFVGTSWPDKSFDEVDELIAVVQAQHQLTRPQASRVSEQAVTEKREQWLFDEIRRNDRIRARSQKRQTFWRIHSEGLRVATFMVVGVVVFILAKGWQPAWHLLLVGAIAELRQAAVDGGSDISDFFDWIEVLIGLSVALMLCWGGHELVRRLRRGWAVVRVVLTQVKRMGNSERD